MNKLFIKIHDHFVYLLIEVEMLLRGVFIRSVWNLVNMDSQKYANHVDILLKYLTKLIDQKMKEPIIRALSFLGNYHASKLLINEFNNAIEEDKETNYRWIVANALYEIKDPSVKHEVEKIVENPKFKKDIGQLKKYLLEYLSNQ